MRGIWTTLSITAIATCSWPCSAQALKIAFGQEKAPYFWMENGKARGIELDIVRSALAVSGRSLTAVQMPNRRVMRALKGSEFDAVMGVANGEAERAFYSDTYLTYENFAITRKSIPEKINTISNIFKYKVAAWQTAWENLELSKFTSSKKNYTEFTSQLLQTNFFWKGRADIILIDRNIFSWYSRILDPGLDIESEVTMVDVLPSVSVRGAFRRAEDRDALNAGLIAIRTNGVYDRIFASYGLTSPASKKPQMAQSAKDQ